MYVGKWVDAWDVCGWVGGCVWAHVCMWVGGWLEWMCVGTCVCGWVGGWVEWKYILAVKEGGELYTGFENPD